MREIVVNVYCDMCLGQGHTNMVPEIQAAHVQLTITSPTGGETREMDLCPECLTDIVSLSREDVGAKPAKPAKLKKGESPWKADEHYAADLAEESWQCRVCKDYYSATEQGIKQHLSRTHKDLLPA